MTRKEFIELTGLTIAAFCVGCTKTDFLPQEIIATQDTGYRDTAERRPRPSLQGPHPPPPPKFDFTIDLDNATNAALLIDGGFMHFETTIVARTLAGQYIAAQKNCTHNGVEINYNGSNNRYECPGHGSVFANDGNVLLGPAQTALKTYKTQLNGKLLRVFE